MDAELRFRALFLDAYPALHRYARYRGLNGLNGPDADDLVAEVLSIAWRRLDDVPADDPLPWLFATARNVWRNGLRATRRRADLVLQLPPPEPQGPPPEPADHTHADIRDALAALNDDDQEILRLVAWDGLSTRQLAATLGCKESAARVRLHRARQRFALHLEPLDETSLGNNGAQFDRSSAETPTEGTPR
jgi:RNA polymerase sigma factor (sigma-70 family)